MNIKSHHKLLVAATLLALGCAHNNIQTSQKQFKHTMNAVAQTAKALIPPQDMAAVNDVIALIKKEIKLLQPMAEKVEAFIKRKNYAGLVKYLKKEAQTFHATSTFDAFYGSLTGLHLTMSTLTHYADILKKHNPLLAGVIDKALRAFEVKILPYVEHLMGQFLTIENKIKYMSIDQILARASKGLSSKATYAALEKEINSLHIGLKLQDLSKQILEINQKNVLKKALTEINHLIKGKPFNLEFIMDGAQEIHKAVPIIANWAKQIIGLILSTDVALQVVNHSNGIPEDLHKDLVDAYNHIEDMSDVSDKVTSAVVHEISTAEKMVTPHHLTTTPTIEHDLPVMPVPYESSTPMHMEDESPMSPMEE
ncbi:MAG: hypothetical protein WBQ73_00645 [Candidatus Babeliales bacterium]